MTNMIEEALEIIINFLERVHESGREPKNQLEFLKLRNELRNVMKSYSSYIFINPK